jgi:multiple sugar transport system permease protein
MPIISKIGTRSTKVRTLYGLIYGVLIVGAITMIYPFSLMLAGSMKSEADSREISVYPKFWTDDTILFRKYAESKHNNDTRSLSVAWARSILTFSEIEAVSADHADVLDAYLEWRETDQNRWWYLGHTGGGRLLPINGRLYRREIIDRFDGSIEAYRKAMKVPVNGWNAVEPVPPSPSRFSVDERPDAIATREFARTRPVTDRVVWNTDGAFLTRYVFPTYGKDVADYNKAHGTAFSDTSGIFLAPRAPAEGLQRSDWETYVRKKARLDLIRIDDSAADPFTAFLKKRHGNIEPYNAVHGTSHSGFDEIRMPRTTPNTVSAEVDWEAFIKEACPIEALEIHGPRQAFEEFVAGKRGVAVDTIRPLGLPLEAADYSDCMANSGALRREFSTRNYAHVFDYIARHGNGIINTIIYCLLAITGALVINPMAAYALSRYRPASTYTILLFCMATMAFPGEVTMIPAFLLLKRFPVWPLVAGIVTMFGTFMVLKRSMPKLPEMMRMAISVVLACFVGAYLFPVVLGLKNVSLLNTFAALILPGMANGFMIFMLKGFFDSLPQELYEAAEIDGASEWNKFWTITMSLSKPILAVFALQAFTAAYSAFMMALIIIPDKDMWTLMIWIFQLQSEAHSAVVYASLVVTAIPTFLVFAFCQNIIIRGIVVPVEK